MSKKAKQLIKITLYMEKLDKWRKNKKVSLEESCILTTLQHHYYSEIYLGNSIFEYMKKGILESIKNLDKKPSETFKKEIEKFSKVLPIEEAFTFL